MFQFSTHTVSTTVQLGMDKPQNAAEFEMDIDIDTDVQSQLTASSQQSHHERFFDTQHQLNKFPSFLIGHGTIDFKLFIIIDTNILLAHLNIVIMLKNKQIAGILTEQIGHDFYITTYSP